MKKLFAVLLILSVTAIAYNNASAQDDAPKPQYMVWEVKVNPVQMDKLIDAIKTQHAFLKEQNYPYDGFVQYTNDGYFWYSSAFQSFADIDKMDAVDKKLWEENAEKSKEIQEKFKGAYTSVGSIILELQPELSILPPQSAEIPTGMKYRLFEKFYIKQDKSKEFFELTKKYKALREKHGYTEAFYAFYPKFGPDMSTVYFIDEMGDSAADHYAKSDKKWEKFGEEGMKLWEDLKPLVEKIEVHNGWADYNASYYPSK